MTMSFAQEANFIIASYAVTVFIVAALIAWVVLDYSAQRRILGDLEERGVTRRSRRPAKEAP
jgi:heme exporter protein D